jgi:hypothetical protein
MDVALSTQLSQATLFDQVGTNITKKGLEAQQQDGQNVLALIASASPSFADPALGSKINLTV